MVFDFRFSSDPAPYWARRSRFVSKNAKRPDRDLVRFHHGCTAASIPNKEGLCLNGWVNGLLDLGLASEMAASNLTGIAAKNREIMAKFCTICASFMFPQAGILWSRISYR